MQIVLYTPSFVRYNPCHGIILLTKLGTSGSKRSRDVLEMLGEFFREAAVLVLIFYPLEMARNGTLLSVHISRRDWVHRTVAYGHCFGKMRGR